MEKFIQNVRRRPALWDTRRPDNLHRPLIRRMWNEIEEESSMEPGTAAKKFKSLKDKFRREYRKAGALGELSKWIYYKHMLFLKDIIGFAPLSSTQGSINENESSNDQNEHFDEADIEGAIIEIVHNKDEVNFGNRRRRSSDSPPTTSTKRARTLPASSNKNANTAALNTKQRSTDTDHRDKDDDGDDFHFLMSCRKYLKQMPAQKKLQFRIKMQELIYKYVYEDDESMNSVEVKSTPKSTAAAASNCGVGRSNIFSENRKQERQDDYITVTTSANAYINELNEFEDIKPDINEIRID